MKTPEPELILSDRRGVFIPRDFTTNVARERVTGLSDEDWTILAAGPDHEHYWDAWVIALDNVIITDDVGEKYRLHQDSDLWVVPVGMEWDEEADWFVWPEEKNNA